MIVKNPLHMYYSKTLPSMLVNCYK